MQKVTVKMDSKVLDNLVANECIDFALYIRCNWLPEEGTKNTWWHPETNTFAYSEELYFYFKKSQSKEKVND